MTNSVLIVLSCGTDNPNRTTRALFLATVAHKEGKKSAVFLLDEGVYIAKKGIINNVRAATGDNADDHISYLQEFGIPIYVCTPCAKSRLISESDLIQGAKMATAVELIKLSCESTVISF
ncbi:MAG: DsrE family protein [Desulfobacterales bacterium]|nr:DsrE family protein [Desulfobacterales bacterium]MBF0397530.1 DsrE family protein [Desulfobacterales bacterium]